jgi:hypothetical protein
MDRQIIELYAQGASTLRKGVAGLTKEELNSFPVPGTWSIQQIVLHLTDSDLVASDRMKRVIAMEKPLLIGYDETAFSKNLFYEEQDVQLASELFEKNRLLTAEILRRLPDSAFERVGQHNERGEISLAQFVSGYVDHLAHHMKFLHEKRALLSKPMS